jgi:hypothetical protein
MLLGSMGHRQRHDRRGRCRAVDAREQELNHEPRPHQPIDQLGITWWELKH